MIKITHILFDFGGVIINHKTDKCIFGMFNALADWYGTDPKAMRKLRNAEIDPEYMSGVMTYEDVITWFENRFGKEMPNNHRDIIVGCMDHAILHQDVYDHVSVLKSKGYTVGLLSDMNHERKEIFHNKGRYDSFDILFNSCNTGHSKAKDNEKDTTDIYDYVLRELGVDGDECLFIDDKEDNLKQAQKVGIHTILATSPQQIIDDVNGFLGL